MQPPATLNLKVSLTARAELQRWLAAPDLKAPIPGLVFGGAPGERHCWSIGIYDRSQITSLEEMTRPNGHSAHFVADGIEFVFWQYWLREQVEGKTLNFDDRRRFFVE